MFQGFSVSLNPIGPWPVLVAAAVVVLFLTLWAYARKLRGSSGGWRWLALSLRLLALLLCLLAALRPSVILQEKKRQAATLVFLLDSSTSMTLSDEVKGPDPVGRGAEGHGTGARDGQVAGTEPRGQGVSVRRHAQGSQAR